MTWKPSLVVLALLTAGCSGGDAAAQKTNGVTQKQLDGTLLTAADVPPGYKLDQKTGPHSTAPPVAASADCPTRFADLGRVSGGGSVLTAQARFQGPQIGTVLQETVARISARSDVAKRIGEVSAVIKACPSFTIGTGTAAQAVTLRLLDAGTIGDQTLAYGVSITSGGVLYAADEVLCSVGRSIVLIAHGGLAKPDLTLAKASARTAVKRLSALPT
jgi:hypothetical protein